MKGKHSIIIENKHIGYKLEVKRKVTFIRGDSATGKTVLVGLIETAQIDKSGVTIICDVPCRTIRKNNHNWESDIRSSKDTIFFFDEDCLFMYDRHFQNVVKETDNYFVILSRDDFKNIPYSVEEIYKFHTITETDASGNTKHYNCLEKFYTHKQLVYLNNFSIPLMPEIIITEDSESGYQFWKSVSDEYNIQCLAAKLEKKYNIQSGDNTAGVSKIVSLLDKLPQYDICVIADGAAIGPYMQDLYQRVKFCPNMHILLPESFEWVILKSGILEDPEVDEILKHTEDYIDITKYFTWENYFTKLLSDKTQGTQFEYGKRTLKRIYFQASIRRRILNVIPALKFSKRTSPKGKQTKDQETTSFFKE